MAMSAARAPWNISAGRTTQVLSTRHTSSRHTLSRTLPILKQQERHYYTLPSFASTPPVVLSPPFGSASDTEISTSPGFKKPEVIEWQENMPINSATFIGTLIRDVKIKYLDSGKIVANSSLKVQRSVRDDSWFYLEFWDDLAEVAAAHLKKDDLVFVSGSVSSEKVTGRDGLEKTFAKVVVQDLKFVLQSDNPGSSVGDLSLDELWKDVFDNRTDWIDYRESKTSIRHPDFKHKSDDIALWLGNKYTPVWVQERLEKEVKNSRSASTVEETWKALFTDPSMWWDNRTSKTKKLKTENEILKIGIPICPASVAGQSRQCPPWQVLIPRTSGTKRQGDLCGLVVSALHTGLSQNLPHWIGIKLSCARYPRSSYRV